MYCIMFNGPPRSGKDTLANHVGDLLEEADVAIRQVALSQPMRQAGFAVLGLTYFPTVYERIKDEPQELFKGETLRQWMIRFSQDFIKPIYGYDYWLKAAVEPIKRGKQLPGVMLITDLGFEAEYRAAVDHFEVENVLIVQVHREDYDFKNDSRCYIDTQNAHTIQVQNENLGDMPDLAEKVLSHCVSNLKWVF